MTAWPRPQPGPTPLPRPCDTMTWGVLMLWLLLTGSTHGTRLSVPGRPRLTSCRSPEKETFTCWWEPGWDGGLPTSYRLFYRKEGSDTVYECPDYRTAGHNSCFFNKNDTSLWVNYNITVMAANALGSSYSEPVYVDVVYIVQPHTPENVSLAVLQGREGPFLRASWEPPRQADTRSGWITLVYELRVRTEEDPTWEEHHAGQQKMFNIFSVRSGAVYLLQVRCKPDHGFWSEWSSSASIRVPDFISRDSSMWILVAVFCTFIFLILTLFLNVKSQSVKMCLLPPVPSPKIKGLDKQLLKDGCTEDVFSALGLPPLPRPLPEHQELLVEYLEVCSPAGGPEEQGGGLLKEAPSDSDSGRGSCDSHSLLLEEGGGEVGGGGVETWSPLLPPPGPPLDYVEVQEVSQENQLLLQSLGGEGGVAKSLQGEQGGVAKPLQGGEGGVADYSKVKGVDSDNVLLLQPHGGRGQWSVDTATECCYHTSAMPAPGKRNACDNMTPPIQGGMALSANGYVDAPPMTPCL